MPPSDTNQTSVLSGDYVEASIGYAYQPVSHDRLNALFKYTFLYDLPGPNQVTVAGTALGPSQRSHIVSAAVSYELNQYLTIGGKYGFRFGEIETNRGSNIFLPSSAHTGIMRADIHIVKNWDVLLEGRVLHTPEIKTTNFGFLTSVHRHVGDNFKVGVGYNFGRLSDDLGDLIYDDGGVFANIVGKI